MATRVEFKRVVRDAAELEDAAELAIGTIGFRGDGDRLFVQWNGTGILLAHDDAHTFLAAAARISQTLEKH